MSFFDTITNYFSGGKQQGAEDMEAMLRQGMGEMKDYTNQGIGYLNPYNQAGMGQIGNLQQMIARMQNPNQFYNDMMSGYQESPMAKHQQAMGTNNALAAASASGMTGSSDLLNDVNQQSQQISNQDQQQYFNNLMGINNQGMNASQHLFDTGFGAAGQQGNMMSNLARSIAQMYGQIGQAQNQGDQAKSQGMGAFLEKAFGNTFF